MSEATVVQPGVEMPLTWIFVDSAVGLSEGDLRLAEAGARVLVLDGARDAVAQIDEALTGVSGLQSIHIVSHGASGAIDLGGNRIDSSSLGDQAGLFARIGGSLAPGGDLMLYGCNVAAGSVGQSFVEQIARLTGADVGASDDLTGAGAHGGDWALEHSVGTVEAPAIAFAAYEAVLSAATPTLNGLPVTGLVRPGIAAVDPLINAAFGSKWGGEAGTGITITYSVPAAGAAFAPLGQGPGQYGSADNEPETASYLSPEEELQFEAALAEWGKVANVRFVQVSESVSTVGDIRIAYSDAVSGGTAAWAYYPDDYWPSAGDIWLNPGLDSLHGGNLAPGMPGFATVLHEVGHALGLDHPNGNPASPDFSERTTIMSYNERTDTLFRSVVGTDISYQWVYPTTPMLHDIAALQYMYGANTAYRAGDDVYSFDPDVPFFITLWDGGGNDTLNVANFTTACVIDLRAGAFSSIAVLSDPLPPGWSGGSTPTYYGVDNLAIAFGCDIENAVGGGGGDRLTGNGIANSLSGGDGNDTMAGGGGADTLIGGAGIDTLDYGNATVGVDAALWRGTAVNDGTGAIDAFSGIEHLRGGGFNDLLQGDGAANQLEGMAGNDNLWSGGGADTVLGGDGNDFINAGAGADTVNGGSGLDTADYGNATVGVDAALWRGTAVNDGTGAIDAFSGIEHLRGGGFNDLLQGDGAANQLEGMAGNDNLWSGGGNDTVLGGDGNDFINAGAGADTVNGGSGLDTADYGNATVGVDAALWRGTATNDGTGAIDAFSGIENLRGGAFNDLLQGDGAANQLEGMGGNDNLWSGGGNDTVLGGDGNDFINAGAGADTVNGGNGQDTLDFGNASVRVDAALWRATATNDGTGSIDTFVGIEHLRGGGFNDLLQGDGHANRLEGFAGNDGLWSGAGNDTLAGGDGADILNGAAGTDSLTGGAGADRFDFDALTDSVVGLGRDVVTDFSSVQLDRIDLAGIDSNTTLALDQAFSYVGSAAFSNVAGELRFAGGIVAGDTNGDGAADFEIQLVAVTSMLASDFIL